MAYLKAITPRTCKDCGARASATLISRENAELADYCQRHGGRALRKTQADEAKIQTRRGWLSAVVTYVKGGKAYRETLGPED